jgi:hypothetical protein
MGSIKATEKLGEKLTCQDCGQERAVNMDDWPDDEHDAILRSPHAVQLMRKLGATAIPNLPGWR